MSSRIELERAWERVIAARQRYEEAAKECKSLVDEWAGSIYAVELIRLVRKRESLAIDEYVHTLRICTELVVHAKWLDEPNS